MTGRASPYLLLALTPLLWAGNWVWATVIVRDLSPVVLTAARWTLAVLLLLPLAWRSRPPAPDRTDRIRLAGLGMLGIAGYTLLQYVALRHTSPINGSLVYSTNPVLTVLLAGLLLREPVTWRQVAGALCSVAGVAVILTGGHPEALRRLDLNPGDLMMVVATLLWALYSILGRVVLRRFSPLAATAYAAAASLPVLWIAAWVDLRATPLPALTPVHLAGVAYMALFPSLLGFVWWYVGVQAVGAGTASVFGNLLPVYTGILSVAVLGERITLAQVAGGGAVVAGVILATRPSPPAPARPA